MPCYEPLRAAVVQGPEGRSLVFGTARSAPANGRGVALPCGRCIGCRLERARQWAVRIVHESKMHEESCFITLTFREEDCPQDRSLRVETWQSFFKKLRARVSRACSRCARPRFGERGCKCEGSDAVGLRFFMGAEYGEESGRPHYHAIIFGWCPSDLKPLKKRGTHTLYYSPFLEEVWSMGYVSVGFVTFDSACYVAKYSLKKVTGQQAAAHYGGRKPEFCLMSRRPGIGRAWIDRFMSDVFPADEVISGSQKARPPRYYDLVLEKVNPEMHAALKLKREAAASELETVLVKGRDSEGRWKEFIQFPKSVARLQVKEKVARAKLALKSRNLE